MENRAQGIISGIFTIQRSEEIKMRRICVYVHRIFMVMYAKILKTILQSRIR